MAGSVHRVQAVTIVGACLWVLGGTAALGFLRLLPWLFVPGIPWGVTAPFAEAIGIRATETALLVGVPVGCAIAAARCVRWDLVAGRGLIPALIVAALFVVNSTWKPGAGEPARVALGLLEQTRRSCEGATSPRGASVPMVGVSWVCFPGQSPRIVGLLPGSGGRAWFSAAAFTTSKDLSRFELRDFRLTINSFSAPRPLEIHIAVARIGGLPPWGRPTKMAASLRSGLLAGIALLIGSIAIRGISRLRISSVPASLAIGGAPASLVFAMLGMLDASPSPPPSYGLLLILAGASAIATVLISELLSRRLGRAAFAG